MSCHSGIEKIVKDTIGNKNYWVFNNRDFIEIKQNGAFLDKQVAFAAAKTFAIKLNSEINNGFNIGKVFYAQEYSDKIGIDIKPTNKQLDALNEKSDREEFLKDAKNKVEFDKNALGIDEHGDNNTDLLQSYTYNGVNGRRFNIQRMNQRPIDKQAAYYKARSKWKITEEFDPNLKMGITNDLTGKVLEDYLKDAYKQETGDIESVAITGKDGNLLIKAKLEAELTKLDPESDNYKKIQIVLKPENWSNFQNQILGKLSSLGFKIKEATIESEEPNINDIEEDDQITGKGDHEEYSAYTMSTSDKMSSRLRAFLSSIPDINRPSDIQVDGLVNKYVPLETLIQSIHEAVQGTNSTDEMISSLRAFGNEYKKPYLTEVANKLDNEKLSDSRIYNQFATNFNLRTVDKEFIKYVYTPKKDESGKFIVDSEGTPEYELTVNVVNLNRNSISRNLRDSWSNNFINENSEDKDGQQIVPIAKKKELISAINTFKEAFLTNFKGFQLINKQGAENDLKEVLKAFGIDDLHQQTIDWLIEPYENGKKHRIITNVSGNEITAKRDTSKVFNTILFELQQPNFLLDEYSIDNLFNTSGFQDIAKIEARYTESFVNTSIIDGKDRVVWGYGLHNPETIELGRLTKDKNYLKSIIDNDIFRGSSYILNLLNNENDPIKKEQFIKNLKISIFDVSKLDKSNIEGKELTESNDKEYLVSQISLFTDILPTELDHQWRRMFITTPSDKSIMSIVNVPIANVKLEFEGNVYRIKDDKNGNNIIQRAYNHALAEYNRINYYLSLDEKSEEKKEIDADNNYQPNVFFLYPLLNHKTQNPEHSENVSIFKTENGKVTLKPLSEKLHNGLTVKEHIRDVVKKQFHQEIENTLELLKTTKVIENDEFKYFNTRYLKSLDKSLQNDLKKATLQLVADFALNYYVSNTEMQMIMLGDPLTDLKDESKKIKEENVANKMDFSDETDRRNFTHWLAAVNLNLSKRMAGAQASGTHINQIGNKNRPIKVVYFEDSGKSIRLNSKTIDNIEDNWGKETARLFQDIDSMDGFTVRSPLYDLYEKFRKGDISKKQYISLSAKVNKADKFIEQNPGEPLPEELNFTEEEKLTAQITKPVYYGLVLQPGLKYSKTSYIKNAELALYPQFTVNQDIDKLRTSLMKMNVDKFVTLSATKLGAKNVVKGLLTNTNGNVTFNQDVLDNLKEEHIDQLPAEYNSIQLEVPYDEDHNSIRVVSQALYGIFSEVLDTEFDQGDKKVTGKELRQQFSGIYNELYNLSFQDLLRDIGASNPGNSINSTVSYPDIAKLQRKLLDQATKQGYSENSKYILNIAPDGKSFVCPITFSNDAKRFNKLLISLVNSTIFQKINGRSFVLSSEAGFTPTKKTKIIEGEEANVWINTNKSAITYSKHFDPEKGLLSTRVDKETGKILPAQVMVTFKFTDSQGNKLDLKDYTYEENGHTFINTNKISPELLKLLGFRIPNQLHPSMAALEIVGFLPEGMADTIIAPQDFTKQFGSDFDIDKLYSYLYNYYVDNSDSNFKIKKVTKYQEIDPNQAEDITDKMLSQIFGNDELKQSKEEKIAKLNNQRKREFLQNQFQDIYHTILNNKEVVGKSLQGVNEGKLTVLAKDPKLAETSDNLEKYNPNSVTIKYTQYFANKSGKTGIGVFANNTNFAALAEGKGIYLQEDGREWNFPIKIDGKTSNLGNICKGGGYGRMLIAYASLSLDNAKLQGLKATGVNDQTMGVAALMCMLANNKNAKDYDEEYVTYFLTQDIIKAFSQEVNEQSQILDDFKKNIEIAAFEKVQNTITLAKNSLDTKKFQDKLDEFNEKGIERGDKDTDKRVISLYKYINSEEKDENYWAAQQFVLNKFQFLYNAAQELRGIQASINSVSKGAGDSFGAIINKKDNFSKYFIEPKNGRSISKYFGNIWNLTKNDNPDYEKGIDYYNFTRTAADLSAAVLNLFGGNTTQLPIALEASTYFKNLTDAHKALVRKTDKTLSPKETDTLVNGLVAYVYSYPYLNIQNEDQNQKELKNQLLRNTETNKNLATEIKEYKKTEEFKQNPILFPLFNSLRFTQDKVDTGITFVEFQGQLGLTNPEDEIEAGLDHLSTLGDTGYSLFEKIVQYQLLVQGYQTPTNFRKFLPNYYLDSQGIFDGIRNISKYLTQYDSFENIAQEGQPPHDAYLQQLYQHNPALTYKVELGKEVGLKDGKLTMNRFAESVFGKIDVKEEDSEIQMPPVFVNFYDRKQQRQRLFKYNDYDVATTSHIYDELPTLGNRFLTEYEYGNPEPITSIIKGNNPENYKSGNVEQSFVASKLKEFQDKIDNLPGLSTINEDDYIKLSELGYDKNASDSKNVSNILDKISKDSKNSSFKALADILLVIKDKTESLKDLKIELSKDPNNTSFYDLDTNTLNLNLNSQNKEEDFLHELVHVVTANKITDNTESGRYYRARIQELIKEAERNLTPQEREILKSARENPKEFEETPETAHIYGLTSPEEFITQVFTKKEFQDFLNKTRDNTNKSLWKRFTSILKGLFNNFRNSLGFDIHPESVLNTAIDLVSQIVEDNNTSNTTGKFNAAKKKQDLKKEAKQLDEKGDFIFNTKNRLAEIGTLLRNTYLNYDYFIEKATNRINKEKISEVEKQTKIKEATEKFTLEKNNEIRELKVRQEIISKNLEKLENEFKGSVVKFTTDNDLNDLQILLQKPNLTLGELAYIQETISFYKDYFDKALTNDESLVSVELKDWGQKKQGELQDIIKVANKLIIPEVSKYLNQNDVLKGTENDYFGEGLRNDLTFWNLLKTHTIGADKADSLLLKNTYNLLTTQKQRSKNYEAELKAEYEKGKAKFSKLDQKRLFQQTESTDEYGNKGVKQNFLDRVSQKYFDYQGKLWDNFRKQKESGNKYAYQQTRKELDKIQHFVDLRYLFNDEFNKTFANSKISDKEAQNYLDRLEKFYQDQFGDISKEYAKERLDEEIKKAKDRYQQYKDNEEVEKATLDLLYPEDEAIKQTEMEDWKRKNNPFFFISNTHGFNGESQIFKYSNGTNVPYADYKSGGKSYIQYLANRIVDNKNTGFYNDSFLEMEKDQNKKKKVIASINSENISEEEKQKKIDALEPTYFEYLEFRNQQIAKLMDLVPDSLKQDIFKNTQLNVKEDYFTRFANLNWGKVSDNELIQKIFDNLSWIKKGLNLGIYVRESIKEVFNSIEKKKPDSERIDLLSNLEKRYLNQVNLKDYLNEEGRGDEKTQNLDYYMDAIRKVIVDNYFMSQIEPQIRLIQNTFNNKNSELADGKKLDRLSSQMKRIVDVLLYNKTKLSGEQKEFPEPLKWITGGDEKPSKYKILKDPELERIRTNLYNKLDNAKIKHEQRVEEINKDENENRRQLRLNSEEDTYNNYIGNINNQLESLKTTWSDQSLWDLATFYVGNLFLGFNIPGRYFDALMRGFGSNYYESKRENYFNTKDYGVGLVKSVPVFIDFIGQSGISLSVPIFMYKTLIPLITGTPVDAADNALAALGFGLGGKGVSLATNLLFKSQIAVNDHLYKLFDIGDLSALTGEKASGTELYNPKRLQHFVEKFNRSVTLRSWLNAKKVTDINGKEHSLGDIFEYKDGEVDYNHDLFPNLDLSYDSQQLVNLQKELQPLLENTHGTDTGKNPVKINETGEGRAAMVFRGYYPAMALNMFSSTPQVSARSGIGDVGAVGNIKNLIKKRSTKSPFSTDFYRENAALLRIAAFTGTLIANHYTTDPTNSLAVNALALAIIGNIPFTEINRLSNSFKQGTPEEKKALDMLDGVATGIISFGILMSLLAIAKGWDDRDKYKKPLYLLMNLISRAQGESMSMADFTALSTLDKFVYMVHPYLGALQKTIGVGKALGKSIVEGSFEMNNHELASNHLLTYSKKADPDDVKKVMDQFKVDHGAELEIKDNKIVTKIPETENPDLLGNTKKIKGEFKKDPANTHYDKLKLFDKNKHIYSDGEWLYKDREFYLKPIDQKDIGKLEEKYERRVIKKNDEYFVVSQDKKPIIQDSDGKWHLGTAHVNRFTYSLEKVTPFARAGQTFDTEENTDIK